MHSIVRTRLLKPKFDAMQKWRNIIALGYPLFPKSKRYKAKIYELMAKKNEMYLKFFKIYRKNYPNEENYNQLLKSRQRSSSIFRTNQEDTQGTDLKMSRSQNNFSRSSLKENAPRNSVADLDPASRKSIKASPSMLIFQTATHLSSVLKTDYSGNASSQKPNSLSASKSLSNMKNTKSKKNVAFATQDDSNRKSRNGNDSARKANRSRKG